MLIDTLKKDHLKARKDRDDVASGLLSSLITEASKVGKDSGNRESTDDEVISTIKKFVKNSQETLTALMSSKGSVSDLETKIDHVKKETEILESYLPNDDGKSDLDPDSREWVYDGYGVKRHKVTFEVWKEKK